MRLPRFAALLVFVLALALAAEAQEAARGNPADAYRIGPGDDLLIAVWKYDPMSRIVRVRPDGKISLPFLTDVQAAGLTRLELREVLTRKLEESIASATVNVIVTHIKAPKIMEVSPQPRMDPDMELGFRCPASASVGGVC
jgi:protein involved in polysaccharide export with SLBB domain